MPTPNKRKSKGKPTVKVEAWAVVTAQGEVSTVWRTKGVAYQVRALDQSVIRLTGTAKVKGGGG